jgi:hypothetical protein
VIIPLEFHRGQAVRCVRGWAKEQLFPREEFEILIASPVGHPASELDEIRALLGPQDRVLELDRHHDMALCAEAAASARGDLLFFTESHCLPEPETVARADSVARENSDWAGFSCRSVPITDNLLSEIEAEWYARDIEFGMNEHPWRKVLDQCFVVRRKAYFEAGGFDPEFGHFAEWLIAARLYTLGLNIGYAPDVRIHHVYIGEFDEWDEFTADFVQGQMAYLALEPPDPLRPMFDEVPEWSRRHMLRRSVARRVCRMLLRDLRGSPSGGGPESRRERLSALRHRPWRLQRSWLLRAVAGHSVELTRARLRRLSARIALRLDLLRRDRASLEVHLGRCCEAIATAERTRFVRTWARNLDRRRAGRAHLDDMNGSDSGVWEAARIGDEHAVGFHAASGTADQAIRWSEPAAYVELPLDPGRHVITLRWLFLPPAGSRPGLRVYLDERPLANENVRIRPDHAEIRVDVPPSSSRPRLGWVCPTYRAEGDNRLLGLPVVSIAWARDGAPAGPIDEEAPGVPALAADTRIT